MPESLGYRGRVTVALVAQDLHDSLKDWNYNCSLLSAISLLPYIACRPLLCDNLLLEPCTYDLSP
jgi:hypothetical protein